MDNILPVSMISHKELMQLLAQRFRRLRLDHFNWSRAYLADQSGVTEATIKRFENTGQITIENILLLAMAMQCQQDFLKLFPLPETGSIAELEQRAVRRQRGRSRPGND
ncbi:MAG: helix-turn-helix domain-containing protein [Gammaproteobacteria bacterium]|nr:helix-turn-helix domain-containing protein [Gammaproteobacteria bacterium]MDH5801204.1 helix-turn-helix domain-containing protein [Gammaproteobacteria bacterium]